MEAAAAAEWAVVLCVAISLAIVVDLGTLSIARGDRSRTATITSRSAVAMVDAVEGTREKVVDARMVRSTGVLALGL